MDTILNNPSLIQTPAQTGLPTAEAHLGLPIGIFLVDKTKVFTAVEEAAIIATLQAMTLKTGMDRCYPIFRFEAVTENTAKPVMATYGFGGSRFVRDSKPDFSFEMFKGGELQFRQYRKLHQHTEWGALLAFQSGYIKGTLSDDGHLMPFALDSLSFQEFKMTDGAKADGWMFQVILSKPEDYYDNFVFLPTNVDLQSSVPGLIGVRLSDNKPPTTTKLTVQAITEDGQINLWDVYKTPLATAANWIVTAPDGTAVTVTDVAGTTPEKAWELSGTFTTKLKYTVALADPQTLSTALIGGPPNNGLEGIPYIATIP